jgi:hypothetical protein
MKEIALWAVVGPRHRAQRCDRAADRGLLAEFPLRAGDGDRGADRLQRSLTQRKARVRVLAAGALARSAKYSVR